MPDAPDFYQYAPSGDRQPVLDNAELAVRLRTPVNYDRRGQVLFFEDFDDGVGKIQTGGTGTGNAVNLQTTGGLYRPNRVQLVAGSTSTNTALVRKYLPMPEANVYGIEVAVEFNTEFELFTVELERDAADGGDEAVIRYNRLTDQWQYKDSAAAFQNIGAARIDITGLDQYQIIKLVVDFDNNEYVRLHHNATTFSLADIPLRTFSAGDSDYCLVDLTLTGREANNDQAVMSHFIVTIGEPV